MPRRCIDLFDRLKHFIDATFFGQIALLRLFPAFVWEKSVRYEWSARLFFDDGFLCSNIRRQVFNSTDPGHVDIHQYDVGF